MRRRDRRGFTLVEVLIASLILSLGLLSLLANMMQCQQIMLSSKNFETAQYVLNLGEVAYPLPTAEKVTDDPLENEILNISEIPALDIAKSIELELTKQEETDLEGYTFERVVDEYEESEDGVTTLDQEDELKRNGGLYTVRTTVRWGDDRRKEKRHEETVIRLWRKSVTGDGGK